jgi:uncharacterized lipoprotein
MALVGSRGGRIQGHHQSSHIRKGSQSSKQTAATLQANILNQHGNNSSSHQQRMGFQTGANNLLMQNYPIDANGQPGGNYSHQRVYSHHDANDLVNQG